MVTDQYVAHEVIDNIAYVRLNRPDKLNALTLTTLEQLVSTARTLSKVFMVISSF